MPAQNNMKLNSEYKNILFCTDFSDDANFAFLHAIDQCKRYDASLHLMHIIISPDSYAGPLIDTDSIGLNINDPKEKRKKLEEQAAMALRLQYEPQMKELDNYIYVVRFGSPDVQIINYADENDINMIVLGVVGKLGSHKGRILKTAANVSRYANCQVVTIGVSKK